MTLTNNRLKLIRSLSAKKNRQDHGLFVAEGIKVVKELLQSGFEVEDVYYCKSEFAEELDGAELVSEKVMKQLSQQTNPEGVLAVVNIPEYTPDIKSLSNGLVPVLDGIRNPGNLGTMIRIADWFGFEHLICSEDTVDMYNSKTIQASMGSFLRVKVHYFQLEDIVQKVSDNPVYGMVLDGDNIYESELSESGLFILGSESHGIRENIRKYVSHKLTIPSFGKAESLNAAMAMAVCCSEFRRRKFSPRK